MAQANNTPPSLSPEGIVRQAYEEWKVSALADDNISDNELNTLFEIENIFNFPNILTEIEDLVNSGIYTNNNPPGVPYSDPVITPPLADDPTGGTGLFEDQANTNVDTNFFYGSARVGGQGFAGSNLMSLQQLATGLSGGGVIKAPIVGATRQKAILQINDFSGGLNVTTGARDIADNQFTSMNYLSSAKEGKLVRLGDFETLVDSETVTEFIAGNAKHGLFYFVWDSYFGNTSGTTPTLGATKYIATPRDSGTTIGFVKADDLANYNNALDQVTASAGAHIFYSVLGKVYFCNGSFEIIETVNTTIKVAYPITKRFFSGLNMSGYGSGSHNVPPPVALGETANTASDTVRVFCTELNDGGTDVLIDDAAAMDAEIGTSQTLAWLEWFNTSEGGWGDIVTNEISGDITSIGSGTTATVTTTAAHGLSTGDIVEISGTAGANHVGDFTIKKTADTTFTIATVSATDTGGTFSTILGGMKIANYRFHMTYVYDNGEETDLTACSFRHFTCDDVASAASDSQQNAFTTSITETSNTVTHGFFNNPTNLLTEGVGLRIKALKVHHAGTFLSKRIKGARIYYQKCEVDSVGNKSTDLDDPYLLCDVDFEKGVRTDFGAGSIYNEWETYASNIATVTDLEIISPQNVIKYETLNLHAPDEIKDIKFKTAAVVNGIPFIGNIKYNDVGGSYGAADNAQEESSTILFAASPAPGHIYSGRFPIRTNRIPVSGGEINALAGIGDKLLVFTSSSLNVINVADYGSYKYENTYQGISVAGSWQVCETPFGVVWCDAKGLYMYDPSKATVIPLSLGKLDDEDWNVVNDSRIGYDPATLSVIVVDAPQSTSNKWYVYNFGKSSFSCFPAGEDSRDSNLAVNFDGYLTAIDRNDNKLYRWNATPSSSKTVELVTKDFTLGSPSNKLKVFSVEVSYTDSGSSTVGVYYRVNQGSWRQFTGNLGGGSGILQIQTYSRITDDALFPIGGKDSTDSLAKSIQIKLSGTATPSFELNDISITYKEKRIK